MSCPYHFQVLLPGLSLVDLFCYLRVILFQVFLLLILVCLFLAWFLLSNRAFPLSRFAAVYCKSPSRCYLLAGVAICCMPHIQVSSAFFSQRNCLRALLHCP